MLLEVHDLKVYFETDNGIAKAVDGVSFCVEKGKTHVLAGESGCGKSVTSLAIIGLLPKYGCSISGDILFNGSSFMNMNRDDRRKLRGGSISMIFQEPMTSLNPVMRIGDQMREMILLHPEKFEQTKINRKFMDDYVIHLFKSVGLYEPEKLIHQYPHQLSGGMRQRVMIAMAISCKPDLIIADEPTTALDVTVQDQVLTLLSSLQKESGSALLLITHNLGVAARLGDTMSILYAGQVVEEGKLKDIFEEPLHPYTQGLFAALPDTENTNLTLNEVSNSINHFAIKSNPKKRKRLLAIDGTVPPAYRYDQLPSLCRFYERCPYRDGRCHKESKREGHRAYCKNRDGDLKNELS